MEYFFFACVRLMTRVLVVYFSACCCLYSSSVRSGEFNICGDSTCLLLSLSGFFVVGLSFVLILEFKVAFLPVSSYTALQAIMFYFFVFAESVTFQSLTEAFFSLPSAVTLPTPLLAAGACELPAFSGYAIMADLDNRDVPRLPATAFG